MLCRHLQALESDLLQAGFRETARGQVWTKNCREWVYFECLLDREKLEARYAFADCIAWHEHRGTHDGNEAGFECTQCQDAVMGRHPSDAGGVPVFE